MVTITNCFTRQGKDGKPFVVLELTGDVEMIQSASTGRFYATAKRCNVPSSFSEETARMLIGKQMPGRIDRVQADPYQYTIKETGEVITLAHTYAYTPEEKQHNIFERPSRGVSVVA